MNDRLTLLIHPKMTDILNRIVEMFGDGLNSLGIETVVANEPQPGFAERAIVFGANFFNESQLLPLARNSVVFNVENVESEFITDEYRRLLRNFHVWDYSAANAAKLSVMIDRPVRYARLFYVNRLSRIRGDAEKDIDVLFYGSFNARRSVVLDGLRGRGLRVEAVYKVFGDELDALIARAKVVINMHFYDNGHLEIIRLFDLLTNACAVVSEWPGEPVDADLANALVLAPYDRLVEATEALVRDENRRHRVAAAGFRAFAQRLPTDILPQLLANSEAPVLPSNAVIGSGKAYDLKMFNININDNWHPDIVADITDPALFEGEFPSSRFGTVRLQRRWFDTIRASHVLEHLSELTAALANILDLLADGGTFHAAVPYDLSYGAWQDPTHVRAFNERSWLYYCEWYWYLGWDEARFDLITMDFVYSDLGRALAARGILKDEILRTPRAVDEMHVVLRKRPLNEEERAYGRTMRGNARSARRTPKDETVTPTGSGIRERAVKLDECLMGDLLLLQTASYYKLEDKHERQRSKRDLVDLFLTVQEKCKPDLSVEIGALQATFSIEIKRHLPKIRAIAFEANPYIFEHFSKTAEIKNSGVEYVQMAIAEHTGTAEFLLSKKIMGEEVSKISGISSLLSRPGYETEPIAVSSMSLSDYLTKYDLQQAKFCAWIDVEGASKEVLTGAKTSMNKCQSMFIEVEQYPYWNGQWLFRDVQRYLAVHGLFPIARDFEYAHQFNVLFIAEALLDDTEVRNAIVGYHSKIGLYPIPS